MLEPRNEVPIGAGLLAWVRTELLHALGQDGVTGMHACHSLSGDTSLGPRLDPAPPRPPRSLGGSAGAYLLGPLASEYVARTRDACVNRKIAVSGKSAILALLSITRGRNSQVTFPSL